MSNLFFLKKEAPLIFFSTVVLFAILLILNQSYIFSFLVTIIYFIFLIAIINNKFGLYLLILLRPCLDFFTDRTVNVGSFNINFASAFAILALVFSAFVILKNVKKIKKIPLLSPWLIFLFVLIISLVTSVNITSGITELSRLLTILLLFVASFILIEKNKDLSILIKVIIISAIVPAIVAFFQFFTRTGLTIPFEGVYNRAFGTFAHPNLLAFYLLIALTLCFVVYLTSDKRKMAIIFYGLLSLFFLAGLAFTYSRSAWIGLVVIVLILGLIRYRIFLIFAIIILAFSYFSVEQINIRIKDLRNVTPYSSIQWRFDLWEDGLEYAKQKPVLGYGVGTSKEIIMKNRGPRAGSPDAHNDYLRIGIEAGVIGLIAYLILVLSLIITLLKAYAKQKRPRLKTLTFIILILVISYSIIGFGDNILANTALQWSLWVLLGGVLAVQKKLVIKDSEED